MFRRAPCSQVVMKTQKRMYTEMIHRTYPVVPQIAYGVPAIFLFYWLVMIRIGSPFSGRAEHKKDYNRVWMRKLGTGYKWADEIPKAETFFKNLPTKAV